MRKHSIPLGLLLFGLLFVGSGLRLARTGGFLCGVLAVFAIAVGLALWRREPWAL